MRELEFLVGSFSGAETLYPPEDSSVVGEAHARGDWETCDRYLDFEYVTKSGAYGTDTFRNLITYDEDCNCYRMWMFTSFQPHPTAYVGQFEGSRLIFICESTQTHWGIQKVRVTFTPKLDDAVDVIAERWEPDGFVRHRISGLQRME